MIVPVSECDAVYDWEGVGESVSDCEGDPDIVGVPVSLYDALWELEIVCEYEILADCDTVCEYESEALGENEAL